MKISSTMSRKTVNKIRKKKQRSTGLNLQVGISGNEKTSNRVMKTPRLRNKKLVKRVFKVATKSPPFSSRKSGGKFKFRSRRRNFQLRGSTPTFSKLVSCQEDDSEVEMNYESEFFFENKTKQNRSVSECTDRHFNDDSVVVLDSGSPGSLSCMSKSYSVVNDSVEVVDEILVISDAEDNDTSVNVTLKPLTQVQSISKDSPIAKDIIFVSGENVRTVQSVVPVNSGGKVQKRLVRNPRRSQRLKTGFTNLDLVPSSELVFLNSTKSLSGLKTNVRTDGNAQRTCRFKSQACSVQSNCVVHKYSKNSGLVNASSTIQFSTDSVFDNRRTRLSSKRTNSHICSNLMPDLKIVSEVPGQRMVSCTAKSLKDNQNRQSNIHHDSKISIVNDTFNEPDLYITSVKVGKNETTTCPNDVPSSSSFGTSNNRHFPHTQNKENSMWSTENRLYQSNVSTNNDLRPVVVDGSNVAFSHGRASGGKFSCKGIELCVKYFQDRGHKVTVFVPQFRRSKSRDIIDQHILERLGNKQIVVFTPSRVVDGVWINSYDDRFILDLAAKTGGVIVSNDNYRDIKDEKPEWRKAVNERLLMFVFVGDHFMVPDDPLGQRGAGLKTFLSFPK